MKVPHGFALGHDGRRVGEFQVVHDAAGQVRGAREGRVPLALGQMLQESVEAFVHPGPLPFIGIHDHGEEVVAHFVDDHAHQSQLRPLAVGAVLFRARAVEAEHRIFHATAPAQTHATGRYGVGVVEGVAPIDLECVRHGSGAVLVPEGHSLLGVAALRDDHAVVDLHALGIPDQTLAGVPCEVTHVHGLEAPCQIIAPGWPGFRLSGFFGGCDEERFVAESSSVQAISLRRGEYIIGILQLAGGQHHKVVGHRDLHVPVSEFQRVFTLAQELLQLPTRVVGVGCGPGLPLGDVVEPRTVLQLLVSAASSPQLEVVHGVVPTHGELHGFTGLEWL